MHRSADVPEMHQERREVKPHLIVFFVFSCLRVAFQIPDAV